MTKLPMTAQHDHRAAVPDFTKNPGISSQNEPASHPNGGHGWLMIACCIPMLLIAVVLVATGALSAGFLVVAIACTVMMAVMMRGMKH